MTPDLFTLAMITAALAALALGIDASSLCWAIKRYGATEAILRRMK